MLISKFCLDGIESKIKRFEQKYDIKLPIQYRAFLMCYNGGFTPETKFKIGKEASDVRAFYGIDTVEYSIETLDLDDFIKKNLLPIACDSFGNVIAMGIQKEDGVIFFCDHEKNFEKVKLTDDFKEFIKQCKSKKINELYTMTVEEHEQALIKNGHGDNITDGLRKMWQDLYDKYNHIHQEKVVID